MKLNTISTENFKCFGELELDLSQADSYCIIGSSKNNQNESNGTGKTTFLDLFRYAFYGQYDGKNINSLIRHGQDSLRVSVTFEVDKEYKIERIRTKKSSFLEIFEKNSLGVWQNIAGRTQPETEAKLQELLQMNYASFCNRKYFSQRDSKVLSMARTPTERRKILKDILDLGVYSHIEAKIKEFLLELNKKIISTSTVIETLGDPAANISQINDKILTAQNNLNEAVKEKDCLMQKLQQSHINLQNAQNQIRPNSNLQNSWQELKVQKRNLQLTLNNSNKTLLAEEKKMQEHLQKFADKEKQILELKEDLDLYKKKKIRERASIDVELELIGQKLVELKSNILQFEERIKTLEVPLPDGEICPSCRQVLTQEHRQKCQEELRQEILQLKQIILDKSKFLQEEEKNQNSLKEELKETSLIKSKIETIQSKLEIKKEELKSLSSVKKHIQQMIDKVKDDNQYYQNNIDEISKKEIEIQNLLNPQFIEEKQKEIDKAKKEIEIVDKKSTEIIQSISKLETNLSFYQKELVVEENKSQHLGVLNAEFTSLSRQKYIASQGLESAKPSGIPSWIIHDILNEFQLEVSQAVQELRPEMDVKIIISDEKSDSEEDTFDFEYTIHGKKIDQYHLSAGQEFTSMWGFRRGFDRLQEKSGNVKNFLFFDEIDQPLDRKTIQLLLDQILKLQNQYKIFMITHNDWVKTKFSHHIQITYDPVQGSTAQIIKV